MFATFGSILKLGMITMSLTGFTQSEPKPDWAVQEQKFLIATQKNPTDATNFMELGRARYEQQKYKEAIGPLQEADRLGVSYPWDMKYFVACCLALNGEKDKAFELLTKAVALGFRDMNLLRSDQDLRSLHSDKRWEQIAFVKDTSKMSRKEGWRYDLKYYSRELKRLHAKPFGAVSEREFDKYVADLDKEISRLSNNQIMARFIRLGAMVNDGHTSIRPGADTPVDRKLLPIQLADFPEGLFVIAADKDHEHLLGSQLVEVNKKPVAEVLKAVDPYIGRENPQWVRIMSPRLLVFPGFLNGVGLSSKGDEISMTFKSDATEPKTETLKATTTGITTDWVTLRSRIQAPPPLTFKNRSKRYWFEQLPDSQTVFAQYNSVANDTAEPLSKFWPRLFKFIDDNQIERLIIDMRWNGGGNNFLNAPLLDGLIKSRVNQAGKLFVITGPNTFSAAVCGLTQIERYTNAIICGEPQGSSPNFIGESIHVTLPYSKMVGTVSDLYWQNSVAMDHRIWISPKIYVPYTFADFKSNHDSVIDAILSSKVGG